MAADLPFEALGLYFHCNRFIVSQANPHVVPFLTPDWDGRARLDSNIVSGALWAAEMFINMDVRQRVKYLAKMKLLPRVFGAEISSVFLQKYSGDATITPFHRRDGIWRVLAQPNEQDMCEYLSEGARGACAHASSPDLCATEPAEHGAERLTCAGGNAPPPRFCTRLQRRGLTCLTSAPSWESRRRCRGARGGS